MSLAERLRAAWRAFRTAPPAERRSGAVRPSAAPPMATAVALTTELSQPGGGDLEVINALLDDMTIEDAAAVVTSAAILAAKLGASWAVHDSRGPAETLEHIGLIAQQRRKP